VSDKTLKEKLARFMDPKAFMAKRVGKEQAERLKARREIATRRADASIRFFMKDENFAALQHRISTTAASEAPPRPASASLAPGSEAPGSIGGTQ
jgi:hypothetical protein